MSVGQSQSGPRKEWAGSLVGGRIDERGIVSRNAALTNLYDIEFIQIGAGCLDVNIDYIASPRSVLYRESYNSSTHALGSLRHGFFGFSLPLREADSVWWGHQLDQGMMATAIAGETIDIVFRPGHQHLVALLDHASLMDAARKAQLGQSAIHAIQVGRHGNLLTTDDSLTNHIRGKFLRLLAEAARGDCRMTCRQFDDLILGAAISFLDTDPPRIMDAPSCAALFRRAVDCFESLPEPPNVSTLCLALNASPRTLEAAFKQCAGMGPHRFFLRRRLNRAHHLLTRTEPAAHSVTDIALSLGFTELGRFAVRYRELFGESPSQTLAGHRPFAKRIAMAGHSLK